MIEAAHLGQGKSENGRHLVSIISFPSSRLLDRIPVIWATVPVMWATTRHGGPSGQPSDGIELVRPRIRVIHCRSRVIAWRWTYAQ